MTNSDTKRLRIQGGPNPNNTKIFLDDMDISNNLQKISFLVGINQAAKVWLTLVNLDLDIDADVIVDDEEL